MNIARRVALAVGIGLAWWAWAGASAVTMPHWFADAVFAGAAFVTLSLAAVGLVSEIVLRFGDSPRLRAFWLAFTIAFAVPPEAYLLGAAFFGSRHAEEGTWDLLPMFVLVRMTRGLILGLIAGAVAGAVARKAPQG